MRTHWLLPLRSARRTLQPIHRVQPFWCNAFWLWLVFIGLTNGAFLRAAEPALAKPPGAEAAQLPAALDRQIDFTKEIRPLFENHCWRCHGAEKAEGGLRLHRHADARNGGDSGPAFVPGKATESRLLTYIAGLEEGVRMPPEEAGPALSREQIGVVRTWLDQGANWPAHADPVAKNPIAAKHWSYRPLARPAVPNVPAADWCRNDLDRFVLARLQQEGLAPSPPADKAKLFRRVCLDLTGLPPTVEELQTYLADTRPDAYEQAVERLLASPHYGERWARMWLDLARYADTHGYEKDPRRTMFRYRDWVIDAFNRDLPFDQFTIEQLAGDLLPEATLEQKLASGFHRNTMTNTEGGVDPEEARTAVIVDRVNTTATVWLGSTLACAQCHTHKYDPFTQKEYFQFYAFFNSCDEPELEAPTPAQVAKRQEIRTLIAEQEAVVNTSTPALVAAQADWERDLLAREIPWQTLQPTVVASSGGATLMVQENHAVLASGTNPDRETYTLRAGAPFEKITGFRLEVLTDKSLPHGGPGRHSNGSFVLTGWEVTLESPVQPANEPAPANLPAAPAANTEPAQPDSKVDDAKLVAPQSAEAAPQPVPAVKPLAFKAALAEYTQGGHDLKQVLAAEDGAGWAIDANRPDMRVSRWALFALAEPLTAPARSELVIKLRQNSKYPGANIGAFRISVTAAAEPLSAPAKLPANLWQIVKTPAGERSPAQQVELARHYRSIAPALQPVRDRIAELRKLDPPFPKSLVLSERKQPRETHVHVRGNFMVAGPRVEPAVPAFLPSLAENQPANRLAFARWLVSPQQPLTARVTVNRFWEQFFGTGLVKTVEDVGTQGEPPSHPELLDWLASEFIAGNWSVKQLQRTIVTSATYRQASLVTPAMREKDPENRLLARGPRFRLEAELVRDLTLTASGLLSHKVGGPSVFPPQPDGVWTQNYSSEKWETSAGEDRYRRGLYTFWRRTSPYPSFMAFDAPSREFCVVRRPRSNTPLQALVTLNDPAFFEAAQALARKMQAQSAGEPARGLEYGYLACVARTPRPVELERLQALLKAETEHFQTQPDAAEKLVTQPNLPAIEKAQAAELAAWTVVANVLLNLDETLTKE